MRAGWSKKRAKPRGHVSKNDALSRNAAHLFSGSVHRRADADIKNLNSYFLYNQRSF